MHEESYHCWLGEESYHCMWQRYHCLCIHISSIHLAFCYYLFSLPHHKYVYASYRHCTNALLACSRACVCVRQPALDGVTIFVMAHGPGLKRDAVRTTNTRRHSAAMNVSESRWFANTGSGQTDSERQRRRLE